MKVEQHAQQLKEEVKKMLMAPTIESSSAKLELIDDIQRLGVAYHFEYEIDQTMQQIHDNFNVHCDDDLHTCALRFRLLRQHGYPVSCGNVVICKFLYIPTSSFYLCDAFADELSRYVQQVQGQ